MSTSALTFNCPVCGLVIHGETPLIAISRLVEHTQSRRDPLHLEQNEMLRKEICRKADA